MNDYQLHVNVNKLMDAIGIFMDHVPVHDGFVEAASLVVAKGSEDGQSAQVRLRQAKHIVERHIDFAIDDHFMSHEDRLRWFRMQDLWDDIFEAVESRTISTQKMATQIRRAYDSF